MNTANGNVGINTTSPADLLDVKNGTVRSSDSGNTTNVPGLKIRKRPAAEGQTGSNYIECGEFADVGNDGSGTDGNRFMVKNDGNVGIGITNPTYKLQVNGPSSMVGIWANPANDADTRHWMTGNYVISPSSFTTDTALARLNIQDRQSRYIQFFTGIPGASSLKGVIYQSGNNTLYAATSDYRLKKNIKPLTNGLEIINLLKPVNYTFIEEPYDDDTGFVAHELQEIIPKCVIGEKDQIDEHGNIIPQCIDKSYIVTHLVSALQQLHKEYQTEKDKVISLETQMASLLSRIEALENSS